MNIIKYDNTKRNYFFESICTKSQKTLKKFLAKEMKNRERAVEVGDGYIYSPGTIPVILTAHMDTVHKTLPKEIVYKNGTISSPQGIGGDDRCGIYMILNIIKEYDCHVLFFEDEEVGGKGSGKFTKTETCKSLQGKINYAIDLDRANANDAVYYNCDNLEFENFIEKHFWKKAYGSFTDICEICPVIGCAGVNFSCGYYKAHTTDEYVVLSEMHNAIKEVKKLIKRTTEKDVYEYVEYDSYFNDWYWGDKYTRKDSAYEDGLYEIQWIEIDNEFVEEVYACSKEEAVGIFMEEHPYVCYANIGYVIEI